MHCRTVKVPGGAAIICGGREPRYKCSFCKQRDGVNLCDFLTGGPCRKCGGFGERRPSETERIFMARLQMLANGETYSERPAMTVAEAQQALADCNASLRCFSCSGSGKANCNRRFCGTQCGVRISDEEGYCPNHQAQAGHPVKLVREECEWRDYAMQESLCLRKGCGTLVQPDERCLYFPKRKRMMDAECGARYLELTAP